MNKKFGVIFGAILSVLIVITIIVFTKDYWVTKSRSYFPYSNAIDVYNASREELMNFDMSASDYSTVFGEVKSEKEAYLIAAKVVKEFYGNDEYPYIVKYNENADAWIVRGSVPIFHLGGVATVAIDKSTGEIIMLIHTK